MQLFSLPGFGPTRLIARHRTVIESLAFSWDGELLFTGGQDGALRAWNCEDGTLSAELLGRSGYFVAPVLALPLGRVAFFATRAIRIWDPDSGEVETLTTRGPYQPTWALSPSGRLLAMADLCEGTPATVEVFEVETRQRWGRLNLAASHDRATCLTFLAEETLAVGTARGVVLLVGLS